MVWCQGNSDAPFRYAFDSLADDVLPLTRGELVSLRAERAKRRAERSGQERVLPVRRLTAATYWEAVLTDLQALRAHRFPEGALPSGQRDAWLFLAANAMSWICPPAVLEREIASLADEAAGWTVRHTRQRVSTVLARAKQAAAGSKLIDVSGQEIDPRYRFKAGTIVDWLEIEASEM